MTTPAEPLGEPLMAVSQWCATPSFRMEILGEDGEWEPFATDGHKVCKSKRWHDEYHGRDPGCCASPEERESWQCECTCHDEDWLKARGALADTWDGEPAEVAIRRLRDDWR